MSEIKFPPLPSEDVGDGEIRVWTTTVLREYARAAVALNAPSQTNAARDVLAERQRQIEAEGWTAMHDDEHRGFEMSRAAACYALCAARWYGPSTPPFWPWYAAYWKPSTPRRNLVKAAALILAEIERLDRAAELPTRLGAA